MNRAVLNKSIYESRWLLLSCAAALYAFCWARVWITSQFAMHRFEAILDQFRDFERFAPVPFEHLLTYTGRIAITYDEPLVVLCVTVWAISRGSDAVSGELGRGTMEMLLAQPVSRLRALWSQVSVTLSGVVILATVSWLGIYTGVMVHSIEQTEPATLTIPVFGIELPNPVAAEIPTRVPLSAEVDPQHLVPAAANLACLGFFFTGLATLLSACDQYRWRTVGLTIGFYILQVMVKLLSLASEHLQWLRNFTIFAAYEPERMVSCAVRNPEVTWSLLMPDTMSDATILGPLGCDLVLLGLGLVALITATVVFCRRDLPAPL